MGKTAAKKKKKAAGKKKDDSLISFSKWKEVEPISSSSNSSSLIFQWNLLPPPLQESILSLLPISTLIRCSTLSKSFCSLIQSHAPTSSSSFYQLSPTSSSSSNSNTDLYFILFSQPTDNPSFAYAYNPILNRWTSSLHFTFPPKDRDVTTTLLSTSSFLISTGLVSLVIEPSNGALTLLQLDPASQQHPMTILDPFTGFTADLLRVPWYSLISNQAQFPPS